MPVTTRRRSSRLASPATNSPQKSINTTYPTLPSLTEQCEISPAKQSSPISVPAHMPGDVQEIERMPSSVNVRGRIPRRKMEAKHNLNNTTPTKSRAGTLQPESPKTDTNKVASAEAATPTRTTTASNLFSPSVENGSIKPVAPAAFQFTFRKPSLELSAEARKIMAESREEAAKIRAKLVAELPKIEVVMTRKTATPKSRAGRFSDAHAQQFNKMDSIARHASAFRADTNRFKPATQPVKRSRSNAGLDSSDETTPRKKMSAAVGAPSSTTTKDNAKRVKLDPGNTSGLRRSPLKPPSIMSPTKASLARVHSIKSPRNTSIPSLDRNASPVQSKAAIFLRQWNARLKEVQQSTLKPKSLADEEPKSASTEPPVETPSKQSQSKLPRATPIKSILKTPRRLYSEDPAKIAAGTHISALSYKFGYHDAKAPATAPVKKHVDFTCSTIERAERAESQSPEKFERGGRRVPRAPRVVSSPSCPSSAHDPDSPSTTATTTKRASIAAVPSYRDFTFRRDAPIAFGKATTSGIRRISDDTTALNPTTTNTPVKQSSYSITSPFSKKRKFEDDNDDDEDDNGERVVDQENRPYQYRDLRAAKRVKSASPRKVDNMRIMPAPQKTPSASRRTTPVPCSSIRECKSTGGLGRRAAGNGALSRARLNLLATPKRRK